MAFLHTATLQVVDFVRTVIIVTTLRDTFSFVVGECQGESAITDIRIGEVGVESFHGLCRWPCNPELPTAEEERCLRCCCSIEIEAAHQRTHEVHLLAVNGIAHTWLYVRYDVLR